jgi:hypothetical protein
LLYFFLFFILTSYYNPSSLLKAQDIDGVWVGNFIEYVHNTYDVQLSVQKLPPGDIFSARLKITNGFYFGEYNVSGYICSKKFLEITTIVLIRETESSNWIDCLNGTFDLNEDDTEMTFTDTWLLKDQKNNACKVKYIQKDMFQCLRSAYLRKPKYSDAITDFNKVWDQYGNKPKPLAVMTTQPKSPEKEIASVRLVVAADTVVAQPEPETADRPKSETKIVAKKEDRAPVIDTFENVKMRPVVVKDEIEVSSPDITIEYWDRYNEDGDSVNVYLNKVPVLENVLLTKAKKSIKFHLDKTQNYLVLHALNVGTEPPNTASVTVYDGKKIQNVSLTSDMKKSGALKINVKKK